MDGTGLENGFCILWKAVRIERSASLTPLNVIFHANFYPGKRGKNDEFSPFFGLKHKFLALDHTKAYYSEHSPITSSDHI